MSGSGVVLGAVAYDRKVVDIWETFGALFAAAGLPFDYVLFSTYERQVEAHFAGLVNVAWNSPLAWLQSERIADRLGRRALAIAMRDTDQDLTSVVLVRRDSPLRTLADLRGHTVATGALDSPQATLLPIELLDSAGAPPGSYTLLRHDVMVGKHGDHVGGERDAVRALLSGQADAACIIDGNHLAFTREGEIPTGATRILGQTAPYDHCNFTVLDEVTPDLERFRALLLAMSYADPAARPALDMEGLKQWKDGRTSGYAHLDRACDLTGLIDPFVDAAVARFAR